MTVQSLSQRFEVSVDCGIFYLSLLLAFTLMSPVTPTVYAAHKWVCSICGDLRYFTPQSEKVHQILEGANFVGGQRVEITSTLCDLISCDMR